MSWRGVFVKTFTGLLVLSWALTAQAVSRVATVGDSITQGVPYYNSSGDGCTHCGGYQPYLEDLLNNCRTGDPYALYNYGIHGETSAGGRDRIPGIISSLDPEIVLFMEGTNDLLESSPETVHVRVIQATNNIVAYGKIPVTGTLLPDTRGNSNSTKRIPEANALIKSTLGAYNLTVAELYDAVSYSEWASKMSDGIHPNSEGYELMADVWYEAMGEYILPDICFLPAIYYEVILD